MFSVEGARVVVMGAARSGVAAAELIARRGGHVVLSERRQVVPEAARLESLGIALEVGGHQATTMEAADFIVLSPGVSPRLPVVDRARQRGVPVMSEIELAARWVRGRIVAITGTKGKSTTAVLTGRMFESAGHTVLVGGNVGTALSSQVDQSTPATIHVVEVSSFQLELTDTFRPWIAVMLNLSADHLDRHATFEEYVHAKGRIFAQQQPGDAMVINADDPQVLELARAGRAHRIDFALSARVEDGVTVAGSTIVQRGPRGERPMMPVASVRLFGRHMLSNVLASVATGTAADLQPVSMQQAVESFTGLEHVLELVREFNGVRFVNDSKATNVAAASAAIHCFDSGVVWIAGGRFKGGSLNDLRSVITNRVDAIVTLGEAGPLFADAFADLVPVRKVETMGEAVRCGFAAARPEGVVLLSPACASLDMFEDYAERGRVFKAAVERLVQEQAVM